MESTSKQRGKKTAIARSLKSFAVGIAVFCACILLFPLIMLKTEDPASYVSIACAATVSLTAFFCSFAASRGGNMHHSVYGIICALVIAAVLFGTAFIFGTGEDYPFTLLMSVMAMVFSLLGSRLARGGKKKRKHRR